jgi:hypothetical protein
MIDRFDEAFDPPAQPARQYEVAPVGEHVVEIIKAEHRRLPWRVNAANPDGDALSLRVRVGAEWSDVLADVPADLAWLRQRLAQAAGIEVDACVPEQLIGRRVTVVLDHVPTRDGGIRAIVRRWLPAAATVDTRSQAPEQYHQRPPTRCSRGAAKRRLQHDDGMPF